MANPCRGRRTGAARYVSIDRNDRVCGACRVVRRTKRRRTYNSDHRGVCIHCARSRDAIYSEDLPRCHAGSPLNQFVSQSRRYRHRHSSSSRSLRATERERERGARYATDRIYRALLRRPAGSCRSFLRRTSVFFCYCFFLNLDVKILVLNLPARECVIFCFTVNGCFLYRTKTRNSSFSVIYI